MTYVQMLGVTVRRDFTNLHAEGSYHTIAGLQRRVPRQGDRPVFGNWRFEVLGDGQAAGGPGAGEPREAGGEVIPATRGTTAGTR